MPVYRFAEIELDPERYVLQRAGRQVPLRPQVFEVLRYLIEHRGRLVTKTELLHALWSNSHVGESVVPWAVSFARRAIGQGPGERQPIETVHRRGYRFVASVDRSESERAASDDCVLRSAARETAEAMLELLASTCDEHIQKSLSYRNAAAKLTRLASLLDPEAGSHEIASPPTAVPRSNQRK